MAQIWHTKPQQSAKMQISSQHLQPPKTLNFKSLRVVLFCGFLHNFAFVMRRSSVRFWLWATPLNILRITSYGVLSFPTKSIFQALWHTHGTLNRNTLRLNAYPKDFPILGFESKFNSLILPKLLFMCAMRVPQQSVTNTNLIKISSLQIHNIALNMRCCGFWTIVVCFCEIQKEMNS